MCASPVTVRSTGKNVTDRARLGLVPVLCLVLVTIAASPAGANPVVGSLVDVSTIGNEMAAISGRNSGEYGMYMRIPRTGEETGYHQDKVFTAASCYKVFQIMRLYESAATGAVDLERVITYQSGDHAGGTGVSVEKRRLARAFVPEPAATVAVKPRHWYYLALWKWWKSPAGRENGSFE